MDNVTGGGRDFSMPIPRDNWMPLDTPADLADHTATRVLDPQGLDQRRLPLG